MISDRHESQLQELYKFQLQMTKIERSLWMYIDEYMRETWEIKECFPNTEDPPIDDGWIKLQDFAISNWQGFLTIWGRPKEEE